jgi:membrane-anchored mycosin MYCP
LRTLPLPNVWPSAPFVGESDKRAIFSTTGPEVDAVAVGQGIVGTVPKSSCTRFLPCVSNGPYAIGDGTSFAAPQVTGMVALMLSRTPPLKADSILSIFSADR